MIAVTLALVFARLSLLAFGGGPTVLPEMARIAVTVRHWITAREFVALFALAQAAPGPNLMISTLIGLRVGGVGGALAATLGMIGPSALLTALSVLVWDRFRTARWRRVVQAGLVPVTVGLAAASATLIARNADRSWPLALLTLAVASLAYTTRIHPLWLLAAGALLGILGLGAIG